MKQSEEPFERIVKFIRYAFFQWNNRVVRNRDSFRTDFGTAFRDITVANAIRLL